MQDAANTASRSKKRVPHIESLHISSNNDALELLHCWSKQEQFTTPVLFLHGIFVGAWCWQHFLEDFGRQGWDAWALSFRGHGNSTRKAYYGLNDFVADAEVAIDYIVEQTGQMPVVVGHSMGGMVLQRLMLSRPLKGALLLCTIPPQGLTPLAWSNWLMRPLDMMHMAELIQQGNRVSAEQLRVGLFAQEVNPVLSAQYAAQSVSESPFLWAELAQGSMMTPWYRRCPVAVMGTKQDRLVPSHITELTAMSYQVPVRWIDDLGHGVMLEQNWQQAAAQVQEVLFELLNS
uniref:AB hydrolase-1 domain-containing protein n=1 Tax=uncultured microorganism TaxID=358574 RepID=D0VYN3_9ZZZZ|nr:hypothetical protein [uncultured microorganism]